MKRTRRSIFKSGNQDANHAAIVAFMSQLGPEPIDTSKVGGGFPDVCWPFQGETVLVEIKTVDGSLTSAQERWHKEWRGGPVFIVSTEDDVLAMVATLTRKPRVRTAVRG